DLMGDGITQIVDAESPSNPTFQCRVGLRQMSDLPIFTSVARHPFHVRERPALRLLLRPDQDATRCRVGNFAEPDIGDVFPHIERGAHFIAEYDSDNRERSNSASIGAISRQLRAPTKPMEWSANATWAVGTRARHFQAVLNGLESLTLQDAP